MWKIGPECAAQQAKYVSAIAANCGVRSACAIVSSGPSAPAVAPGRAAVVDAGGSRTRKAAGMMTSHTTSPITSMATGQSYVVSREGGGGRGGRRGVAHEEGSGNDDEPHNVADHQHGEAPVIGGDEPAGERPDDRRADAEARRDERDRETAVPGEPPGGRRGHRRVEAARRQTDDHPEDELELAEAGRLARRHQAEAEQDAAGH